MLSKEEAQAAGWAFVHAADEKVEHLGDGITRTTLAIHRAEKYVNGKLVNQAAHSEEALLAAIDGYEEHLRLRDPESAGAVPVSEGIVGTEPAPDSPEA